MKQIIILASGGGTLAQSILEAVKSGNLEAEILALFSDQPRAGALHIAGKFEIPVIVLPMQSDRNKWDEELFLLLDHLSPDLIVSAGFMRILSPRIVENFKIINSHPALLPSFPGAHAVADALAAGADITGTTIHWVDSGVDTGKIIAQQSLSILPTDTVETLHERIKIIERSLLVETIISILPTLEIYD